MKKLRLLVVFASLDVGGAEVQFSQLLSRLDKNIFDIQVAYYDARTGFPKEILEKSGIPVRFLGNPVWNKWSYLTDAIRFMRKGRFDIVHCLQHSTNFYGWLPAAINRVPVIIGGLQGKIELDSYWPKIYSLVSARCSGWIVNSETLQTHAEKSITFLGKNPFRIVPNGIEIEPDPVLLNMSTNDYQQLRNNRPVIGTVGRLQPVKNQLLFLQMARDLVQSGVDADFWIIGKGPLQETLAQRIVEYRLENHAHLLGFREDISVALKSMDIFVLTSNSESCPNVLLEAMRAALPVVSTRCTNLEEIIHEGKNGFTVDVGDHLSIARQVERILADPIKALAMGNHSRQIVTEHFSMDVAVQKLQQAYLSLAAQEIHRSPQLATTLAYLHN
ncbi:MAG: glycosyltransferase [Desulfuromonadales bacterium]|nr:glycosyltransferase [Desulfuromonadales bacterium]